VKCFNEISIYSYFGELHIVHYNTKYTSFAEATKHSDGLAVLGILIELGPEDNKAMQQIVQQLEQVMTEYEETNLFNPIPIGALLPDSTGDFYRYQGSLVIYGIIFTGLQCLMN
jgi:carbonic anhydrase